MILDKQNASRIGDALIKFLCNGNYFTVTIKILNSPPKELGRKFQNPSITFSSGNEERGFIFMHCGPKNIGVYYSGVPDVKDPIFLFKEKSIEVEFCSQYGVLTRRIYKMNE
jgi:hypothetical protein